MPRGIGTHFGASMAGEEMMEAVQVMVSPEWLHSAVLNDEESECSEEHEETQKPAESKLTAERNSMAAEDNFC